MCMGNQLLLEGTQEQPGNAHVSRRGVLKSARYNLLRSTFPGARRPLENASLNSPCRHLFEEGSRSRRDANFNVRRSPPNRRCASKACDVIDVSNLLAHSVALRGLTSSPNAKARCFVIMLGFHRSGFSVTTLLMKAFSSRIGLKTILVGG